MDHVFPDSPVHRLNIRVDDELGRLIEKAAKESTRSRCGEVVHRLKASFFDKPEGLAA